MRFLFGFLFGLIAGVMTLASAIGGFVVGLIASGAFAEDAEANVDEQSVSDKVGGYTDSVDWASKSP